MALPTAENQAFRLSCQRSVPIRIHTSWTRDAGVATVLLALAQQAKKYNIGFTVDAEEADRLDLSLDIFEKYLVILLTRLGRFGLAVQAYQNAYLSLIG